MKINMEISGMRTWKQIIGRWNEVGERCIFVHLGQKDCFLHETMVQKVDQTRGIWLHIPKLLNLSHWTSLEKCHSWWMVQLWDTHGPILTCWGVNYEQWCCSATSMLCILVGGYLVGWASLGCCFTEGQIGYIELTGWKSLLQPLISINLCSFLNMRGL